MKKSTFNFIGLLIVINCMPILNACSQSKQTVDNLTAFSKAYGYVKYFHPSDEAYALDWNKFSAYGAKEVANCKNNEELVKALNRLFAPIAPSAKFMVEANRSAYNVESLNPSKKSGYKEVYWQHNGVSFKMRFANQRNSPYKSVRVNKRSEEDRSSAIGNLMTVVEPENLAGKEFKYEGWAKLEPLSKGQGQFWIRVDLGRRKVGFFNNSKDNPVKESQWTKFEIKGKVDSTAQGISLGCFLMGKGTLYVDNIKLSYKDGDKWIESPIKNSDFEIEEIYADRNGKATWNGIGNGYDFKIQSQETYSEKKAVKIAYKGDVKVNKGEQLFECQPAFGELIEKELTKGIWCQIPLVLLGNKSGTYPASDKAELDSLIAQVSKVKVTPDDLYCRIGNIVNTYNVFQHFYPYFDVVDLDWDKELISAIQQSFTDKNGADHQNTLLTFTAKLKDGHINVHSKYSYKHIPPIMWEWVENKLVITHVKESNLSIKVGDVVESINGETPSDYFTRVRAKISAANKGWLNYKAGYESLSGEEGSTITIRVNAKDYELTRKYTKDEVLKAGTIVSRKYHFYNDSSIVYLNIDLIEMDTINHFMPALEKSKAIICDLRGYPNGNHGLINHLLKENDTDSSWMLVPQIIYPDQKKICGYKEHGWLIEAKEPYLGDKQVIFITDGRAISYAESYLSFIEGYNLATIVGQPSAGTNGNINPFTINSYCSISWTGMKVVKHDGSQHHGIGILPDVEVYKTIEGVKAGKDEFLDKALEMIK
jgi:C-terminal processing protease CtpA/Prc